MGARKLHRVGGENFDEYPTAPRISQTEVKAMIDALNDALALTDDQLTALITVRALQYTTAAGARAAMEEERDRRRQQLVRWDLDTTPFTINEPQPTLLLFDPDPYKGGAVVDSCGAEVTDPHTNVLTVANKWVHLTNHTHWIELDLGHPETIDAVASRFRRASMSHTSCAASTSTLPATRRNSPTRTAAWHRAWTSRRSTTTTCTYSSEETCGVVTGGSITSTRTTRRTVCASSRFACASCHGGWARIDEPSGERT